MLVHELIATRQTLYLTTMRHAEAVRSSLERAGVSLDSVAVRAVGPASRSRTSRDGTAMLEAATAIVSNVPQETNVIVDPVDVLERTGDRPYLTFLNNLRAILDRTDSVGVLHCLSGRSIPDQRDVTDHVADVSFRLSNEVTDDGIETRLVVPKFRGQRAVQETVKLDLSETVTVDMSRNIA
jgi:hypothetical protein